MRRRWRHLLAFFSAVILVNHFSCDFLVSALRVSAPGAPSSNYVTKVYSQRTDGNYPCSVYLDHLSQELGGFPTTLVLFSTFIGVLESPDMDSDKNGVETLHLLDPMADEFIPHDTWLNLLYSCTIPLPSQDDTSKLQRLSPEIYRVLRPRDSVLQRVIKLGMSKTLLTLRNKGFYDESQFFHARDEDGNTLMHLAALSHNIQVVRQLADTMATNVIFLLDGDFAKNRQGKRPWDIANDQLDYAMKNQLNGLYTIYRTDDGDRRKPPKRPPQYTLPDIRVVERLNKGSSGSDASAPMGMNLPPGWHKGNQNVVKAHNPLPVARPPEVPPEFPPQFPPQFPPEDLGGSAVLDEDVAREQELLGHAESHRRGGGSKAVWTCLAIFGCLVLLGIGGGAAYVSTKPA